MNCDKCGRTMEERLIGWRCARHGIRMSRVEDRRMLERGNAALVASACFTMLALAVAWALCVRGCQGEAVVAGSVCEACGAVIGEADLRCRPARAGGEGVEEGRR